jgi:hypothetical protein
MVLLCFDILLKCDDIGVTDRFEDVDLLFQVQFPLGGVDFLLGIYLGCIFFAFVALTEFDDGIIAPSQNGAKFIAAKF